MGKSWIRRNAGLIQLAITVGLLVAPIVLPYIQSYFNSVIRIYEHGVRSGELGGLPYFNTNIQEWRVAWNAG
ncbi:MAG: hypothetical protein H3Z51_05645 [archaeon]|nr:hypothetical protein [archaeon]